MVYYLFMFFFFVKQKTAYEMRISDWSSDVCSSDLSFFDDRGFIKELWNAPRYLNRGLGVPSVQTNFSRSRGGVVRGLHYQEPHGQGKLVTVTAGEIGSASCRERVCQSV